MEDREIVVVSGLPRSGTSMLMKMLEAGGLEALTDGVRKADEDNPGGYYEFERVKKVKNERSWLEGASGKVVKIISRLLCDLPVDYAYKVIFMQRDMDEVLASQRVMLARRGMVEEEGEDDEKMARLFAGHLEEVRKWLADREQFEVLHVDYGEVLRQPLESALRIEEFLRRGLDVAQMAAVVDDGLYRQRRG